MDMNRMISGFQIIAYQEIAELKATLYLQSAKKLLIHEHGYAWVFFFVYSGAFLERKMRS